MLTLNTDSLAGKSQSVLLLGAHCDDIEIGCAATIARWVRDYPQLEFYWVVLSSNPVREREARRSAELLLTGATKTIVIRQFRNGYFPYVGAEIKDYFEQLKQAINPSIVFTHYGQDNHQDHRLVSELTWNTFRDHLILEYEIPKYDGGMGSPNVFIPANDEDRERKINVLMDCFSSEHNKRWFTPETFNGLMRLRGVECNAPSGYAEAFYCRKIMLSS